jgi:ornithine cyclodeaminase/alanine dehydrogenase-like protein (mu-crystallin family)
MRFLSAEDIQRAVPMRAAIDAVAAAFARLATGGATVPLRTAVEMPAQDAVSLFMPAYLSPSADEAAALGMKIVSIFPHNLANHQLPTINAIVLLIDPQTGRPLAVMDAGYLTALRTGAGSGVATRAMARPDSKVLALFGAGAQARTQALAVCAERPIERILIVNRSRERAESLIEILRHDGVQADLSIAAAAAIALAAADIVCCATSSPTPLFADADLRPGTHINAVGAFKPDMAEVPPATVQRARLIVDQRAAAWAEAGDLIQPRDAGLISEDHPVGELGQLVIGQVPGRISPDQITLFKSVGNAVQDLAVAALALAQANR